MLKYLLVVLISVTFGNAFATAKEKMSKLETATFAAGCFWGTEEFFRKIPGVVESRVGFTGGTTLKPKYDDIHDGHTGHAESVEVKYDPSKVSYEHLLDQFFKMHDPTTKDRQGNDTGNQYRSAIFYHCEKQKKEAFNFKKKVEKSGAWKSEITTEISEAKTFWPGEEYHQKYLVKPNYFKKPGEQLNVRFMSIKTTVARAGGISTPLCSVTSTPRPT